LAGRQGEQGSIISQLAQTKQHNIKICATGTYLLWWPLSYQTTSTKQPLQFQWHYRVGITHQRTIKQWPNSQVPVKEVRNDCNSNQSHNRSDTVHKLETNRSGLQRRGHYKNFHW